MTPMSTVPPISSPSFHDDGHSRRTAGTIWSAIAHIIAAVIGPAALSLPWALAQLGWVAGPTTMLLFSVLNHCTSTILADCYPDEVDVVGTQSYSFIDVVQANLDGMRAKLCEWYQVLNVFGVAIGCIIIASTAELSTKRTSCSHESGRNNHCHNPTYLNMTIFGILEIILSQIPSFDHISWLSNVAAVLSFTYPTIGLGLGIAKVTGNGKFGGSITGVSIGTVSQADKIWRSLQVLGAVAFNFSFSIILIDIQATLRSPSETKTMKRATLISEVAITLFYMLCGCIGYAAFGDSAPKNLLTGFGYYNPYWLLDIANVAMFIHQIIAYQVYCQPLFKFIEKSASQRFPDSELFAMKIKVPIPGHRPFNLSLFRLVWRTVFVILTTIISMLFPFDDVAGLLSVLGFWLFTVYYPVEIYIKQKEIPTCSIKWWCLKIVSGACLIITIAVATGSVAGVICDLKNYKPFGTIN